MYKSSMDEEKQNVPSTSYTNPDLPHISMNITDAMNRIGFSEIHRERRVKVSLMHQMQENIFMTIAGGCGETCYLRMGSSIEGTTTEGMGSDVDNLSFSTLLKAYCKPDCEQTMCMVFIRDKNTPAGYTKLQVAHQGCLISDQSDLDFIRNLKRVTIIEEDSKGRLLMAHLPGLSGTGFTTKHGPADSLKHRPNQLDQDYVQSVQCDDITNEMKEWCKRYRKHDWPSKETRDLFKTLGCFVVPVGHPSSPENDLEWRMSFSLQERHLMWRLNPTQYHCFMLLKLIKTFFIKPLFGDVLTSYHCKTLLFYTIERHEKEIWVPKNLISCLRMCLILLNIWISDKNIPNYFIPEENMYVKVGAALKGNYEELKSCVAAMCDSWQFVFLITFNDLGQCFSKSISGKQLNSFRTEKISVYCVGNDVLKKIVPNCVAYINKMQNILQYLDVVLTVMQTSATYTRYNTFEETIQQLYKQCFSEHRQTPNTPERVLQLTESFAFHFEDIGSKPRTLAVTAWKSVVHINLGSALAAMYFKTGIEQYLLESDTYLTLGKSLQPISSMLVKASVLLKQSLFDRSNEVLNTAEMTSKDSTFTCDCFHLRIWYCAMGGRKLEKQAWNGNVLINTVESRVLISLGCLCFKCFEFDTIPSPLTFEAYRSFKIPTESLSLYEQNWVDMVAVDPVMYMFYLQFLTNQHNNPGEAAVALHKFETTLFERLGRSDWHETTLFERLGRSDWHETTLFERLGRSDWHETTLFERLGRSDWHETTLFERLGRSDWHETTLFERLGHSDWPGHTDTWLNVLGDIFVKKGWTRLALRCFKLSYKLRPIHNAVRWHVMFLLFSPSGGSSSGSI